MTGQSVAESASVDSLSPEQQDRLMDVLERFVEDVEHGFAPDADQLVAQHPDLAGPLKAHLDSLKLLHQAADELSPSEQAAASVPDLTERRLGDYTLIRQIGRGGMGIVYEARQISLDRPVAIKILPFAAVLDEKQIERFKNEARAAAQLHHPNIVPVFSVGCERGVHYYAMQYIEGQALDVAIGQLRSSAETKPGHGEHTDSPAKSTATTPSAGAQDADTWNSGISLRSPRMAEYARKVAEIGIQVAEALHYAHEHGIIHRDVKPSNLLVDGQGKVWITDFGLARFHADSGVTMTGDVIGTLRYMSPEQAVGRSAAIDERTDVYSLGITLYELLTLRDALEGPDRQEVLRRIAEEEPPAPRRLNPAIPVDLETIVLKAISKSRDGRYTTARELADDLRRFLEGKPTLARRPTLLDRAGKWARRHKTAVRFAIGLAGMAFVGLVVSTLLISRAHWQVKEANTRLAAALEESEGNRQLAEGSLQRATAHFRRAREVVDLFGTRYSERLSRIPGAEPLRYEALRDTLDYYHEFIEDAGDDPSFERDLAVAYSKIGTLTEETGDQEEALAAHRQARQLLEGLVAARPHAEKPRADLALCSNNIGLLLGRNGKIADARDEYRRAIAIQERLLEAHPKTDKYRSDLALSYSNLGLLESRTSSIPAADRWYREALRIQEQLARSQPDNAKYLSDLALSYNNLSCLYARSDRAEAIRRCRQALAIQTRLAQAHPSVTTYQSDMALSYCNLGALQSQDPQPGEAEASYLQAIAIQEQLARKAPSVHEFRQNLAISYNNLGRVRCNAQELAKASESFEKARALLEDLVDDYPNDLDSRSSLGGVLNNLGMALEQLDRPEEALAAFRQAIEHQKFALNAAPNVARFREFLSKQYWNYGRTLRAMGRAEEAGKAALARQQLWPGQPRRLFGVACELALAVERVGGDKTELTEEQTHTKQQLTGAAVAALEQAIEAGFDGVEEIRETPDLESIREHPRFGGLIGKLRTPGSGA